jgi:hypothetical protein
MKKFVLPVVLVLVAFSLISLSGCGGSQAKLEQYIRKADEAIVKFNGFVARHNDIQSRLRKNEDAEEDLQKLHEEVGRFRKEVIEPFVVKDPELKDVHAHLVSGVRAFEDALAMYIESPDKSHGYNELIDRTNDELAQWTSALKKAGQKCSISVVTAKSEQGKAPSGK